MRTVRLAPWPPVLAATALAAAACGSSSRSAATGSTTTVASACFTVKTAMVNGVGTVLVNGNGRNFDLLTSEKGGELTCTDSNGCTGLWPDTKLPSGVSSAVAGAGVQGSLLGTVRSSDGKLLVTYAGYPLYLYAGDSGPGKVGGEGMSSFGGTWWAISPSGAPATRSSSSTPSVCSTPTISSTPTTSHAAGWGSSAPGSSSVGRLGAARA
jgi:predicted lipoprotein with Yx(FWY)xxD motif